jgi:hypothetical protein
LHPGWRPGKKPKPEIFLSRMVSVAPNQSMQTSRKVGDAMRGSNATSLADCSRRSDCGLRPKKCLEADQHELHSH